jgi:hypothetical protein
MICTVPTAIALTRPEVDTVATPVLLELQVIRRPVSTLLFASRVVAVACVVRPVLIELLANATLTEATGTGGVATVSVALPL